MEFGKLSNIEGIDFKLPADAEGTSIFLSHLEKNVAQANIYVGCTGWAESEWVGKIYKSGSKSNEFLQQYGVQFNTIELNATHYRIPNLETIEKWVTSTPDHFKFCPKIPQMISHSANLGVGGSALKEFVHNILRLREKLGCCFIQLPPYFAPDRLQILERFLAELPNDFPMAVEIRHESWFSNEQNFIQLFSLLEKYNCSTVITDVAGRRDVLHQRLTTPTAMIRFVGNGLHPTDYTRIDEWTKKINTWIRDGIQNIYFFCHEPDNLLSPQLADYFITQILSQNSEVKLQKIHFYDKKMTTQMNLF